MAILNQTINGYTFAAYIASGSFGMVYKAQKSGRDFAVKIFREEYILQEYKDSDDNNRVQREIDIMKSVDSPYLIKYIDDFRALDSGVDSYFLVMEYAEGKTLRDIINNDTIMSEDDIIDIFVKIVKGIKALHQVRGDEETKGIIHRDLKPENIIVGNSFVKIIDYGLSKIIDYTSLTSTGNFLGSPLYASPEQINDSKNIDKRSDIYTLGVILYEMYTKKTPYEYKGVIDLIDKIKNVPPIPPRKYNMSIDNKIENIIFKLLEKQPYMRYSSVDELLLDLRNKKGSYKKKYDLSPRFVLRLWNDGSVLQEFIRTNKDNFIVDFPAIHQFQQESLLKLIQRPQFTKIIDPETVRFAYNTYTDKRGLKLLPYCPPNFNVITPNYLNTYQKQKDYVKLVIDEEAKLGADIFVSPYHYTHNTTVLPTYKQNPVEQWFDLDIKLLRESIDYKNSVPSYASKELYAGICINSNSLIDTGYKNDLLNYYSAHECDGYIVYADGIDRDTNAVTLFHYIDTILKLQNNTGRPVIAGRMSSLGFGLLSLGIAGFSAGAARFESFSEELHKEASAGYNMSERYYFPQLLGTISVDKKTPTRLTQVSQVLNPCQCPYCKGKSAPEVIIAQNNKLHYLYWMNKELEFIKESKNKLESFIDRVRYAIKAYEKLPNVYKKEDYKHLQVWLEVFNVFMKSYV